MKATTFTLLAALLVGLAQPSRAAETLSEILQKGLFEEEANHNLDAAIKAYQGVLQQTDEQRKLAATAVFRLGECFRKLGKTNDATAHYERILREFGDQTTLADLSRQNLAGLGATSPPAPKAGDLVGATDEEEKEVQRIKALIKDSPDLINSPGPGGRTPLHQAAEAGQLVVARFLLANGANLNARTAEGAGSTALHLAAAQGHKSMTELLLANGANVSPLDGKRGTPLHVASASGYKSVVEILIANKADVNARNEQGQTPLHLTAEAGQQPIAELLLAKGADINATDSSGQTSLHLAVQGNHPGMVDLLLSQKAQVNLMGRESGTPLFRAVRIKNLKIVESLLNAGADVNLKQEYGTSALREALDVASPGLLELLLAHKPDLEALDNRGLTLLQGAIYGNGVPVEIVRSVLAAGANVNAPFKPIGQAVWLEGRRGNDDITDNTPLIVATRRARAESVEALLAKGAQVNATSPDGKTALYYAVEKGSLSIVQAILARHPDTEIRAAGYTPLFVAQDLQVIDALIEAGADVNVKSPEGKTLLHYAVEGRSLPRVQAILTGHPDTEIRDQNGSTPLRKTRLEDPKILEALLNAGADPNATYPSDGNTLLHHAVANRRKDSVELLVTNKANVNVMNKAGETPLVWAQRRERYSNLSQADHSTLDEIATFLLKHGADENIARRSFITLSRKERNLSDPVFFKGTNAYNRYTLLDLIAAEFGESGNSRNFAFAFPDFANVTIKRLASMPGSNVEVKVDLEKIFSSGECSGDVGLEWGDIVEIPELDHGVNEGWLGLTEGAAGLLKKCLKREVEIVVKGEVTKVTLMPSFKAGTEMLRPTNAGAPFRDSWKTIKTFRLKSVVNMANVVRLSSDLSRVKVKRADPKTNQAQEMLFNLSDAAPAPYDSRTDLWLRDGDLIEVPEK